MRAWPERLPPAQPEPEPDALRQRLQAQTARVQDQAARLRQLAASEHLPSWEELLAVYEDGDEAESER